MYQLISFDFNGIKTVIHESNSLNEIKELFCNAVKNVTFKFYDIQSIAIIKDCEVLKEFTNWQR